MGTRCIFFTEGPSPTCQILWALGIDDLAEDDRAVLQDRNCTKDRFVDCPLFQKAERGLAEKHLRLGCQHRTKAVDSIRARRGTDAPEQRNGTNC